MSGRDVAGLDEPGHGLEVHGAFLGDQAAQPLPANIEAGGAQLPIEAAEHPAATVLTTPRTSVPCGLIARRSSAADGSRPCR